MHNSDLIPLIPLIKVNSYGIDYNGPIPVGDNEETIELGDLENFISDDQSAHLKDLLSPFSDKHFSQEGLLAQYTIAKSFLNN